MSLIIVFVIGIPVLIAVVAVVATISSIGGVVDEEALLHALEHEKVAFAGLDVFQGEPIPSIRILMHPRISLTPHIGAATLEAQERVGDELAEQLIKVMREK